MIPSNKNGNAKTSLQKIRNRNFDWPNTTDSLADLLRSYSDLKKKKHPESTKGIEISFWRWLEKTSELAGILKEIYDRNMDENNQVKQLKSTTTSSPSQPLKLIVEDGKVGTAVRQRFYIDVNKRTKVALTKDKRMQFVVRKPTAEKYMPGSRSWSYPDCLKWCYSALNNYSGYKLLHFNENDIVVVLGAIHSKMLIGFVLTEIEHQGNLMTSFYTLNSDFLCFICFRGIPELSIQNIFYITLMKISGLNYG